MIITRVETSNGSCTITTTAGRFERWPGRKHQGRQWWSWIPNGFLGRPIIVTVPETIEILDAEFDNARGPAVPHLRLVKSAA